MSKKVIGFFVGSLRKDSFTKAVAHAAAGQLPEDFEARLIDISDLPLYNQDLDDEGNPPAAWERFRAEVKPLDGFVFATPEYNRSVPAVLKNALDVGSRPYGQSIWDGKPGAIISVTPGSLGAFGANHHLRQSMTFLNVPLLQQPEMYISGAAELLDENGNVSNPDSLAFLKSFADAFAGWVNLITAGK